MKHRTQVTAILISFLVLGSLLPVTAQAATVEELTLQVRTLTAQVTLLQAQLAARTGSQPTFSFATPAKAVTFDQRSYTSISHNPEVGGSATVPSVFVIIRNDKFEGLVGTEMEVVNGTWTYKSVVALPSGYYTVDVFGGDAVVTRTLHVL